MGADHLDDAIAALVDENVEECATIQQDPSATIAPRLEADSAGERAVALLEQLNEGPAGIAAQVTLGETLGEGGMGIVRIGEQRALGRHVAVKSTRADRRSDDARLALLREAWVTGRLEHPNVVPIYHLGIDDDGDPMVLLKKIDGVEWGYLIDDADGVRRRFGEDDLLAWNIHILLQVANAVRFAHSRGVIHRDLKPQNVMIGQFGEVYVLDWGLALSLQDDGSGRLPLASAAAGMAGTAQYMAPEMLGRDDTPLSERTDVYLLGAILYELIAGQPPHSGDGAMEILANVARSQPAFPDDAPAALVAICRRAMAPDPGDRYPSATELHADLQEYLRHRGSERLAGRARERLDELASELAESPGAAPEVRERLYRLFGECRFGFREALTAWPDNPVARSSLREATVGMIEYELAIGEPRAASSLVAELDDAPPELVARIDRDLDERERERVRLAALGRDYDFALGARTRTVLMLGFGTIFTVTPIMIEVFEVFGGAGNLDVVTWSVSFLLFVLAVFFWARDSMTKTSINRRVMGAFVMIYAGQIALAIGAELLELPVAHTKVLMLFLWFVLAAMFAVGIDRRVWPGAVGYLGGFLLAAAEPGATYYAMAAGNGIITITAVYAWRPRAAAADPRASITRPR